jgi:steroid 5-alpha reductase family enzyme
MLDWLIYAQSFVLLLAVATIAWLISLVRNDVSSVDTLWSLFFLLILASYLVLEGSMGARAWLVLGMVTVWSMRLSVYITLRNHGKPEDHRYQAIRKNNEPHFRFKSLYIVFGLQAVLAGLIAMPLLVAATGKSPLGWLDALGVTVWFIGMGFEVIGDYQLSKFRADGNNRGKVLDSGLWALSRHPNYFGEFTLWWGYFILALAAGGWWTILSPLLMSVLLLKVSGVALMESNIGERRPAYARYIRNTNAFFPGPSRRGS